MHSSKTASSWSAENTAERHKLICQTVMEYGKNGGFDGVIVAAGFDHCRGETMVKVEHRHKLWTIGQMKALGNAVYQCALDCHVLKVPVSVLEGGYEEATLRRFLPAYAVCSAGTDVGGH